MSTSVLVFWIIVAVLAILCTVWILSKPPVEYIYWSPPEDNADEDEYKAWERRKGLDQIPKRNIPLKLRKDIGTPPKKE